MNVTDVSPQGASHSLGLRRLSTDRERLHRLAEHVAERLRTHFALAPEVAWLALEPVGWADGAREEEARALFLLVLAMLLVQRGGSTRLPLFEPDGRALLAELLTVLLEGAADVPDVPELVTQIEQVVGSGAAAALVGSAEDYRPFVLERPHLSIQRMFTLERAFVTRFEEALTRPDLPGRRERLPALRAELEASPTTSRGRPIVLGAEQWAAVEQAVSAPLTVISGGPGTGKTTIVVTILRALGRLGIGPERIALAAPTGKAANRMAQAIRTGLAGCDASSPIDRALLDAPPACRTLHRLLGSTRDADRFKHHRNNRLPHQVVIVDEGSMIDLFLMERTLGSLSDEAQFILLGDADQLPSVEAGAVLRDLIPTDPGTGPLGTRARRLTQSHRQAQGPDGAAVLAVARAINAGGLEDLCPSTGGGPLATRSSLTEIRFRGVEHHAAGDRSALDDLLRHWYDHVACGDAALQDAMRKTYRYGPGGFVPEDRADIDRVFAHLEGWRVLCLTHAARTGAERLNKRFHEWVCDERGLDQAFVAGEPVMMLHNDYDRQVFNGDQGVVLFVEEPGAPARPMAVFPRSDGHGVFHPEALAGALTHAFAITVHKSQGSEFDRVLLVLPDRDLPINTRELLYTAVTRARSGVLIHGPLPVLEAGARRRIRRFSGIAEHLGRKNDGPARQ